MGRFFDLHVEHSSLLDHHDSRRNLCRLSADQLTLIRSTYNNASLVMQVDSSSAKKSMTALPFSKDSEKNRRYVGDNDVYQLFSLLDALMAIILDEHDMWYAASDADTRLLIGKEDLVAGRDCPNIEQLTQVAQCLSPLDWLLILHCQLECERLTFMEYFDLQHKSQSTLASVCLILPSISAVPAEATRSNQLTLLASTASPSRTWNQSSMSAIVSRSCNGLGEDEVMLACLRIEHELIEQQSLYKKRRIMLPLILPLCNHKCYEAAKFILAYLKREAAGAASHELLDLHYMSNLGYILPSTDFSQPAVLPLHETYCKPHHHRLSVLTPIHFAILHGRRDILGLFMDCFPLFKVDYHQLRAFVCMHGLHSDFCYFIYLLDNLHMTLFIPSVISASGVSDCFDVLSGIDHVNRHIYLAQLTDSAVLSVQSLRWRLRNDYCLYSSIMGDIERFALPFEIQLAHQGVNRTCVDCESDINVLLMDKTLLPAKAVQSSAYNLARAMPIQLYSQSAVFSLVHAVVFCDQLSNKDRSIILEDFLSLMPSKAYRFMQLHSSGVNSQCQPPLDRLLISQEFALSKQVLRLICETANLYLPSGAVPDEAALQSRLYEKLVYYCSYHPNVLKPLELTQCNFLFTVLQKNEAALSKLSIRNELCLMLKHNLQRLQGEFDIQYVGFDAVLQRQLYLKLGSYKTPTLSADFSDFMIFLPLLQQFTTHLFGIMTRPLLTNSYKVLCDHPMRYFMQYSLSSSFEKFDIFVRARQVLSILNIPFSQLAQTSSNNSNSQIVETDDDGDFKTLRLCESLSISSFHALKDLVSGFYNIRSQLDAMPNRHENVPVNCEFARIGPKQLGFAKLKTEECLISYHAPFASFVELGSSGLTVPQFMRRRKLNSSGRPSVEGQYAYKTLSQTNENFDLMRVLHLEAKGHSMPATIKHGNNSAADSVANIDMETQASASLMIALDMAYLIMEFGRFIALQKTLILCSSTCSSITASHNRAKDDFDTSGSYLQKLLQRQELHPLYAQQKERDALLQEQKIIKNVSAIHTLFEPPNRNSVSLLPLKGYDSRLCICDGLQGGMLKMLFHLNVGYSARITKMRDIVSGLVVNLLIDLGHVNYAELICRVLLSHSQKSSGSKSSFSLADKKHVDVETVAPDGRTKQSKSYVKAEDKVEAFQHILSILQSLSVQMLVSLNQQDNVKRFRKEFERLQSWLNGVVDPSDEKIDPKEWKDSIYSLRRGEFLAPNRHEVTYVMNILTDFQTSKDMRSSKKVDVINEAVSNLHVMCHTLSVLYWHVAAIYGLVAKNSGAARGCPEVQVSSRVLYEMIADSRRHLSNHDTGGILSNLDMRSDAVKKLLSLGCQITSTFPTSPPSMSVLSSLHRNSSDLSVDRLSLIEVAALYGDAQMLQQLLETCFLSNNNTSSAWEQLKLAKTLVFACLLAMPGSQKVYLRKQYYKCIELLLEYNFPLCSPSASLSTLDLCVVQQATPVLSALLTAYMGAVASDRALHKVPILSTDEVIEMKFAPHMWALVGSNKADLRLGNECKHKLLSLLGWRLGHVKELKPIDLESLLQKSMEELQPYLLNLRHVLPSDGFCGDISEDHSETIISHLGNSMRKTMSALIRGSLPLSWAIKRDVGSMYSYCPLLAWPQKSSSFSLLYLVVRLPQIGGNADQYETYFSKCQSLLFTYESIWSACCYVEDLQHDSAFDVDTWSSSVQHSLLKELVQVAMGAVVYQNAASLLALHSRSCDLAHGGNTGQDDVGRKVNDLWLWVLEAALECSFTSAQGKQGIPRSLLDALLAAPSLADHETLTRILTLHKKCFNLSNVGSQRKFSTSNVLVQAFVRGVMTGTGRDNQLAILLTHVLEVATMHDSFSSILNLLSSLASTTVVQVTSAHYRYSLYYSVVIHNMVSTLSVLLPILPVNVHEVPDGFDLSLLDMAISLGFKEVTNKLKPFVNKVLLRAVSKMIYFLRTARFRRLSNTHGAV
ncbi:hypothetical protein EON65_03470 [archaeon]|nr:MAG: hypothetical protein EON65_03470 [archaeon]